MGFAQRHNTVGLQKFRTLADQRGGLRLLMAGSGIEYQMALRVLDGMAPNARVIAFLERHGITTQDWITETVAKVTG